MHYVKSTTAIVGCKTQLGPNSSVHNWECCLMQVDLFTGYKMAVLIIIYHSFNLILSKNIFTLNTQSAM